MSDEDDYLSDKFLVASESTRPKTYSQRRQEALQQSDLKNAQNRTKSRRQLERESREEGLGKSLFQRAEQEKDPGAKKAFGIMMKMGFQPGQSLGKPEHGDSSPADGLVIVDEPEGGGGAVRGHATPHRKEPLPLSEWTGKKGIGTAKRTRSPASSDRIAKIARVEEEEESFRDRSRREYEERHAESRLVLAQRTCANLDEKAGISFNALWLDANVVETFPPGMVEALAEYAQSAVLEPVAEGSSERARLRAQMQADALMPVKDDGYDGDGDGDGDDDDDDDDDGETSLLHGSRSPKTHTFQPEAIQEAAHFLRSDPVRRLHLVLAYLRDKHAYCFWCGTQYDDGEDMGRQCPGPEEGDHD